MPQDQPFASEVEHLLLPASVRWRLSLAAIFLAAGGPLWETQSLLFAVVDV